MKDLRPPPPAGDANLPAPSPLPPEPSAVLSRLAEDASSNPFPPPAPANPPRLTPLSPCEREVAQLVGQGLTNEEVARRLDKSVLTVKQQLRSIYQKLDIVGRERLIALLR